MTISSPQNFWKIAVVIPCYGVSQFILPLLQKIGPEAQHIFCIDDACPENSGKLIQAQCSDSRVKVIFHEKNKGVGGAVLTGYRAALEQKANIIVKLDGDGQMDPKLIPKLIYPLKQGKADYTKGNRFYSPENLKQMPFVRKFGNFVLSFMNKFSSGYWNIFDPTNGYTAIHSLVAQELPLHKIHPRYFFESDMLFRLHTIRAVVMDVPIKANYGEESSYLRILSAIRIFLIQHIKNFFKRIFYTYFIRSFSIASIELLLALFLLPLGTLIGIIKWHQSALSHIPASAGSVMLAALPIMLGFQLLLAFFSYDLNDVPKDPLHPRL